MKKYEHDKDCPWCGWRASASDWSEADDCQSVYGSYICSRRKGHDGKHVACGVSEHEYDEWTDKDAAS